MKIALITIGKTQDKEIAGVIADYSSRIARHVGFEFVEMAEAGKDDIKLIKAFDKYDHVFLLDERGREYRSIEFADFLNKQMNAGVKAIAFVVGSPFGFSDAARTHDRVKAGGSIALSKMTFPHDLVRAIFLEQLYRAFSILKNEKYHHE